MLKSCISLSLVVLIFFSSCSDSNTKNPKPISESDIDPPLPISELDIENSLQSCENLFGLWDNFDVDDPDLESISNPMERHVPKEVANAKSWDIDDSEIGLLISINNLNIPSNIGSVLVVDDLSDQNDIFEPVPISELTESLNHAQSFGINSGGENIALCIFRGLRSTDKCEYGIAGEGGIVVDDWEHVVSLFAVGIESNNAAFLGFMSGGGKGCPISKDFGEQLVGPVVESEQIVNLWNEARDAGVDSDGSGQAKQTFLQKQRLTVYISEPAQYLILLGIDGYGNKIIPILYNPTNKYYSDFTLGLVSGDQFTSISLQEVEIKNVSVWQQHDVEKGFLYTLENVDQFNKMIGKDLILVGAPIVLMKDGIQSREPTYLGLSWNYGEPDIYLEGIK